MVQLPPAFVDLVAGRPAEGFLDGDTWLARLPRLLADCLARWQLTVAGPARHGMCALVVPVRREGEPLVLKVTWPHVEAEHEHLALRAWSGEGAVRLAAADPSRWALLLERLDADRDLQRQPLDAACGVIGDLLRRLRRPALPQLRRLSDVAAASIAALADAPPAIPRRFVEQARATARELAAAGDADATLLHTDLHFGNVLAGAREPWLAIDPKPLAADPAYGIAPALWNRSAETRGSNDARRHLRRRLAILCERAGVEEDRARGWAVVREVENAVRAVQDGDPQRVTLAVTVIKAVSG